MPTPLKFKRVRVVAADDPVLDYDLAVDLPKRWQRMTAYHAHVFWNRHESYGKPTGEAEVHAWCVGQFGPPRAKGFLRSPWFYQPTRGLFMFADASAATAFRLRWG